ncbi:MAG: fibronectin type III domain-containing protein [Gemmatimonadales bacterium]
MRILSAALVATLAACSTSSDTPTSSSTTPTAPGAPVTVVITAGNASASIAFATPLSDGGAPILSYTATCTASGVAKTATAASSPITVSGLTNGTVYSCSVTATNSVGTGPASASVQVTPRSTP